MENLILLATGYLLSIFMAWCIGANDASNPTETAVGAGAISLRSALILFSIFAFLGSITQGYMVIKTIGGGVTPRLDYYSALSAVIAAGVWIMVATYYGLPISTTHSIVGAVTGVGLAQVLIGYLSYTELRFNVLLKIVLSWILSPITGILFTILTYKIMSKILVKTRSDRSEKILRYLLVASLAYSAYSFGANDVGNATGVYLAFTKETLGLPDRQTMFLLSVIGALGICLGGLTWGKRVIVRVAYRITRLNPLNGFSAEISNALVVWLFTTIPYMLFGFGMPISTTYVSVATVMGAGLASSGGKGVNWKEVLIILSSWVLTLPVTLTLGLTIRLLFNIMISR